jgi:hypothetical protein
VRSVRVGTPAAAGDLERFEVDQVLAASGRSRLAAIAALHIASGILSLVARIVCKRFAPSVTGLALCFLVVPSAAAQTEAGSTESLKVSGGNVRIVGGPFKVTLEGIDDGAHRLYVYSGTDMYCPIEHVAEPAPEAISKRWLSSPEGEVLPQGPFVKTFEVVYEEPYVVCAYLYAPPARFPDAWGYGCFAVSKYPEGGVEEPLECFMPILEPWVILGGERSAREHLEQYEREQHEKELRERGLEAAKNPHVEPEPDVRPAAPTTHLCHVPALRGHTLAYAKRMLHTANCSLGKITVRRRGARVYTQRPHAGSTLADNAKVSVILER